MLKKNELQADSENSATDRVGLYGLEETMRRRRSRDRTRRKGLHDHWRVRFPALESPREERAQLEFVRGRELGFHVGERHAYQCSQRRAFP